MPRRPLGASAWVAAALASALAAGSARAACNAIPEPPQTFRGSLGTLDTPFGRPDAPNPTPVPDPRNVEVGSNPCAARQLEGADYVVTVIFKPPHGGPNIVVLTAQADCSALTCDSGQSFHCVSGGSSGVLVDTAGNTLRFRFPDTNDLVPGDGRTLTGPALVAVSRSSEPLPCKLAGQRCEDPDRPEHLFACVDEIFEQGSCGTGRGDLDATFPNFTALPPMNEWRKLCKNKKPPCEDLGGDLLLTVDQDGAALLPVSWAGVLAPKGGKRGVDGGTKIGAEAGHLPPIRIPSDRFLTSLPTRGRPLWPVPPTFKVDPAGRPDWLDLTGDTDKPESVLRVSRRKPWQYECQGGGPLAAQACRPDRSDCATGSCVQRPTASYFACVGGVKAGSPCTNHVACSAGECRAGSTCVSTSKGTPTTTPCQTDANCAVGQECGRGLFELRDRLEGGVGPIVISPADFEAKIK
jgi:hypothetical protein